MISDRALEAIEASDSDELLRAVDGYCENKSWAELVEIRQRCQEALTRGKQLWGVDEHIRYRIALEGPPELAAEVLAEGAARFALGPLPEVAASTKTWSDMEPYLGYGPERSTFAAERAVRGDLETEGVADLPNRIQPWEPTYPVATYKADKVETPTPHRPDTTDTDRSPDVETINDPHTEDALADLVHPWTAESNGRCQVVTVEGPPQAAIAALGTPTVMIGQLGLPDALAWMAWAGASGGAHGRRRGMAAGRYGAWWTLAAMCDLDWPANPEELGSHLSEFEAVWFDDGSPSIGWELRVALHDRRSGLSWAITAADAAD